MSVTTPVYESLKHWSLGALTFENRNIAGPTGPAGPAGPTGPAGPAGPAAPATTDDDAPAATLVAASPAEQPAPAGVERDKSSGCPEAAAGTGVGPTAAAVGQQAATGPEAAAGPESAAGPKAAAGPEAQQGDEMRLSSLVLKCPKCKSLVLDALIPTIENWNGKDRDFWSLHSYHLFEAYCLHDVLFAGTGPHIHPLDRMYFCARLPKSCVTMSTRPSELDRTGSNCLCSDQLNNIV